MKTFKMTCVLLALLGSFNTFAGSMGMNSGKVECTESHQSGRYEGGKANEVKDYTSESIEDEGNGAER